LQGLTARGAGRRLRITPDEAGAALPSRPSRRGLLLATVILVVSDRASAWAGGSTIPGGPLDETAHVVTTLLAIWAIRPQVDRRILWSALVASVAIDIDHIPGRLGADWLTAGTPRPYTHSLSVVAGALFASLLWKRRRRELLGIAVGVLLHLARDLAEGGVPLWWPISRVGVSVPHVSYLAAMMLAILVCAYRCRRTTRTPG